MKQHLKDYKNKSNERYILDNPFYYGEMRTKKGLIRHVYEPLITKELWDRCQEIKAQHNMNVRLGNNVQAPHVLRGLIRCGLTDKICVCEVKKKKYNYIFCFKEDESRMYVPESYVLNEIDGILQRIKLPEKVVKSLKDE